MLRKTTTYAHWALILFAALIVGLLPAKISVLGGLLSELAISYDTWVIVYWCVLIIALRLWIPRMHSPGRLHVRSLILSYAVAGSILFFGLFFCAGAILKTIAATPYDISPGGILSNLLLLIPALVAQEMVRTYVLGTIYRNSHRPFLWNALLTVFLVFMQLNVSKIAVFSSSEDWFIFVIKDVLPMLSQGALLSLLSLYGGASASALYAGLQMVLLRVIPVLPSLPWIAESALGITFPLILLFFVETLYKRSVRRYPIGAREPRMKLGSLTTTLVASIGLIWFVIGVFPVYPSVVLTGSMEPMIFPGDVVLIRRIAQEKDIYALAAEDVINFKRNDYTVTHRIIEVVTDEAGNVSFRTKGDNNKTADVSLLSPNDINGIVFSVVPKVGLPVLWLRGGGAAPEGVVN